MIIINPWHHSSMWYTWIVLSHCFYGKHMHQKWLCWYVSYVLQMVVCSEKNHCFQELGLVSVYGLSHTTWVPGVLIYKLQQPHIHFPENHCPKLNFLKIFSDSIIIKLTVSFVYLAFLCFFALFHVVEDFSLNTGFMVFHRREAPPSRVFFITTVCFCSGISVSQAISSCLFHFNNCTDEWMWIDTFGLSFWFESKSP